MKPIRDLSLSITITAVALAWLAHPAFAEQPKIGQRAVTTQELSSAADYWTPERRASAIPRDARATGNAAITPQKQLPSEPVKSSGSGLPEITGGGASAEQDAARENRPFWSPENDGALGTEMAAREEAAIDPGTIEPLGLGTYPYAFARYNVLSILYTGANRKFPYTAVGKLFFTLAGVNYVCSASVIRPHLLLTARHCVYDYNSGVWGTNVTFYPGYSSGSNATLGGAWLARQIATWVSGAAGWDFDIGMIQTFNKNRTGCKATSANKQIESFTGYLGYKYGGSYDNRHFDDFGYPQAAPFNGKVMVQCEAATGVVNSLGAANTVEIGCDQTGGTSGGPWLDTFVPGVSGANNYAASVNSFRWVSPNRPLAINGPQFMTANFLNLLTYISGLACP